MLFGELRHRFSLAYAFNDLLLYVRMDALSGFGHRAAVRPLEAKPGKNNCRRSCRNPKFVENPTHARSNGLVVDIE